LEATRIACNIGKREDLERLDGSVTIAGGWDRKDENPGQSCGGNWRRHQKL